MLGGQVRVPRVVEGVHRPAHDDEDVDVVGVGQRRARSARTTSTEKTLR
jgi:hypothetical protein